jgi:hypothetical protein
LTVVGLLEFGGWDVAAVFVQAAVVVPVDPFQHGDLYRAAKADPGRRFHALQDKVYPGQGLSQRRLAAGVGHRAPQPRRGTSERVRPPRQQPPAVLVAAPEVDDLDPVPVDRAGRADLAAVGEVAPEGVCDRSVAGVESPATRCGGTPTWKTITVSLRAPAPTPDPGCEPAASDPGGQLTPVALAAAATLG